MNRTEPDPIFSKNPNGTSEHNTEIRKSESPGPKPNDAPNTMPKQTIWDQPWLYKQGGSNETSEILKKIPSNVLRVITWVFLNL